MEEKLTLFKTETVENEFELGKKLWDIKNLNRSKSLNQIFKESGLHPNLCRRAYYSYLVKEVCELNKMLENTNNKEKLLNYKNYMFVNYSKLFKAKIGTVYKNNITEDLKEYIFNFFIKTYTLTEKELRKTIEKELENIQEEYNEKRFASNIFDGEKEALKLEVQTLKLKITELKRENKELNEKMEDTYSFLNSLYEKIKREHGIFLVTITAIFLIISVFK